MKFIGGLMNHLVGILSIGILLMGCIEILIGIYLIVGALFFWKSWYGKILESILGEIGARIFYIVIGIYLILKGIPRINCIVAGW